MTDDTDRIGERIRAASQSVSTPLALREHLERERQPTRAPRPYPSRLTLAGVGATLAIIATMAALLAPDAATVQSVAAAALRSPVRAAPAELYHYLPGFRAVGARTDTVGGHDAVTVIYRRGSVGVHYTVVDGDPLDLPGTRRARAGPLDLALTRDGDLSLVSWHNARGQTCILASKGADSDALVALLRRA